MPPKRRRVENRATPPGSEAQAVPGLAVPGQVPSLFIQPGYSHQQQCPIYQHCLKTT